MGQIIVHYLTTGTGSVDTSQVYSNGRYNLGPDRRFIKYQADAHIESFEALGVFSGKY